MFGDDQTDIHYRDKVNKQNHRIVLQTYSDDKKSEKIENLSFLFAFFFFLCFSSLLTLIDSPLFFSKRLVLRIQYNGSNVLVGENFSRLLIHLILTLNYSKYRS